VNWLNWLKTVVAWAIMLGFGWYLWLHREDLSTILSASPWAIALIAILIVLGWFAAAGQTLVIYRSLNIPLTLVEGLMLTTAGGLGSYLPMRAGTLVRAQYMKDVHNFSYLKFGGVLGLRSLLTLIAAGSAGLAGLLVLALRDGTFSQEFALAFTLMVIGPIGVMLVPIPSWHWLPKRFQRLAENASNAYDELRRRPVLSIQIVGLLWIQYGLLGFRFIVSAMVVESALDQVVLMMMAPLAAVMQFAAITPGGLGLREGIMGYVSMNFGYSFSEGIFIGTLDRALLLIMIGTFGGLSLLQLWRIIIRSQRTKKGQ
jgi:hypothetical protein